jgi:MscS family membrane protein
MTTRTAGLALVVVLASGLVALADEPRPTTTTTAPAAGGDDDLGFTSPRSTMRGFLLACRAGHYEEAAEHLDLRRLPKTHRAVTGPLLARDLKTVLDRTLWVDVDTLSDAPEGDRDDGLPPRRDLVGTIRTSTGTIDVVVEHVPAPDGSLQWKVASDTIAAIPTLYAEFGNGPLADYMPDVLNDVQLFDVRLWQWIALGLLAAFGLGLGWLTAGSLLRVVGVVVPQETRPHRRRMLVALTGPLRILVTLAVFSAGLPWLGLSLRAASLLSAVGKTAWILALTWLWIRVVDGIGDAAIDRLHAHGRAAAVSIVPLGRRTVKIFVATIAAIAIAQNLGYDATGIIAGLGIGGLALALAAQKTVENLFGGIMLITDQPVRVGDQCRFGTRVGTVEDIGLRSTRLRTAERTIVSVPNAEFAGMQIENLSVRDRMLLSTTLSLKLATTAAQVRQVLDGVRTLLQQDERILRPSVSVRLVAIGAASLDIEMSAYVLTPEWDRFLSIREDIYLKVLDLLAGVGTAVTPRETPTPPARPT